jgi:hypothetical protein
MLQSISRGAKQIGQHRKTERRRGNLPSRTEAIRRLMACLLIFMVDT